MIKESEIDELSISLKGLRISCLLAGCLAEPSLKNYTTSSQIPGPADLNEAVKAIKQEGIEAFSSKTVHGCMKTVLLGNNMYAVTQAPEKGEEPCLQHSLSMVNTYSKMTTGSSYVAVVNKNQTDALIIICKGIKVTWVVAANRVPSVEVIPGTLEMLNVMQGIQQTRMSIELRKEMLL